MAINRREVLEFGPALSGMEFKKNENLKWH